MREALVYLLGPDDNDEWVTNITQRLILNTTILKEPSSLV